MNKPEMFTSGQVRILETLARGLGAKDERESIIKLIEEQTAHHAKTHYQGSNCSTCNLIALIEERSK